MSMTASNIMFSPFGLKSEKNQNAKGQTNSNTEFAGFATGAKQNTEVENKDSFDDEIPF